MKLDNKMLMEMIEQEVQLAEREPRKVEYDHEGRMAKGELRDLIKNAITLYKLIDKEDELPGWVSSYISLASDYMHSVAEYMVEDEQDYDDSNEHGEESEAEVDSDLDV
jgi:hypothetical protein